MKLSHLVQALILSSSALLLTVDAQAQGRNGRETPYATSFIINVNSGSGGSAYAPDPVPTTKRLIVEFVSVTISAQPGDKPLAYLMDSVGNSSHNYWIPLTLSDATSETWRASQMVKLNHDGNGTSGPGAACLRAASSFLLMSCQFSISGYLVDK